MSVCEHSGADIWDINTSISLYPTLYTQRGPVSLGEGAKVTGAVNDDWPLGLESSPVGSLDTEQRVVYLFHSCFPNPPPLVPSDKTLPLSVALSPMPCQRVLTAAVLKGETVVIHCWQMLTGKLRIEPDNGLKPQVLEYGTKCTKAHYIHASPTSSGLQLS